GQHAAGILAGLQQAGNDIRLEVGDEAGDSFQHANLLLDSRCADLRAPRFKRDGLRDGLLSHPKQPATVLLARVDRVCPCRYLGQADRRAPGFLAGDRRLADAECLSDRPAADPVKLPQPFQLGTESRTPRAARLRESGGHAIDVTSLAETRYSLRWTECPYASAHSRRHKARSGPAARRAPVNAPVASYSSSTARSSSVSISKNQKSFATLSRSGLDCSLPPLRTTIRVCSPAAADSM